MRTATFILILTTFLVAACGNQWGDDKNKRIELGSDSVANADVNADVNVFDMKYWPKKVEGLADEVEVVCPEKPLTPDTPIQCYLGYLRNLEENTEIKTVEVSTGDDPCPSTPEHTYSKAVVFAICGGSPESRREDKIIIKESSSSNLWMRESGTAVGTITIDLDYEDGIGNLTGGLNFGNSSTNSEDITSSFCNGYVDVKLATQKLNPRIEMHFQRTSCLDFCRDFPDYCTRHK